MKRIYNYISFKIHSTKLLIFFTILVIYQFSLLLSLIFEGKSYTVYDFIWSNFSYLTLFYFTSLIFLIMIYNIFEKKNFYNYLSIKFASRQEMYIANILTALIFSIIFLMAINIISILMGSFMSFNNSWSEYFFSTSSNNVNLAFAEDTIKLVTESLTPLSYVFITNIFVILYLVFISILFIVFNLIFKKRALSFILIIILNGINMAMDNSRFLFTNNIYILNSKAIEVTNGTYIISRLCYWIILILLVSFIGFILTKKKDCNFGD